MKKIIFATCFVFLLFSNSQAQLLANESDRDAKEFYFLKGDKAINLSVGLLNASDFSFSLFQASGSGDPSPSIELAYEYGLIDQLSIAGFASYYRVEAGTSASFKTLADQINAIDLSDLESLVNSFSCLLNPAECSSTIEERVNVFTIGGKLRYHQPLFKNLDTYASTYVGYSFNRRKTITETALQGAIDELGLETEIPSIVYYGSIGARYFITSNVGIWGEYGIGNVHLLNMGLTYRY